MPKLMSTRHYVECLIDEYNKADSQAEKSQRLGVLNEQAITETRNEINNRFSGKDARMARYREFSQDTKKALLEECIYRTFNASLSRVKTSPKLEATCRAVVDNFVNEQGVETLLSRFRTETEFLSELAYLVDKYHAKILEGCDKEDCDTFKVNTNLTDNFYEELDAVNADEVIYSIRNRVADAMNDFIDQNAADKEEIKQVLKDTKERIDSNKEMSEDVQESYTIAAKRKISNIRNSRGKNIFEVMVESLLHKAYADPNYQKIYFEGANPNMDKIVESCNIMYTFLETVNTAKMIKVDQDYIREILSDMT